MKKIILLVVAMVMTIGVTAAAEQHKKDKAPREVIETIEYDVNIDCERCVKKIMDFMPHQKGIKKVNVDLRHKRAVVVFDAKRTSNTMIIKAFRKIDIAARKVVPKPAPAPAPAPRR